MMRKQNGFTVFNLLVLIFCLAVIVILITRVVPAYVDQYQVKNSIKSLREVDSSFFSEDPMTNVSVLRSKLVTQLDINGVKDIKNDQIQIVPGDEGKFLVRIKYTVIKPLLYNVSLMFDFDEAEEISVNSK
jgi:hypothetical protein